MSTHQNAAIEDTIFLFFGSNNTSGSGDDGASPVFDVRLAGAAAGAIPVHSGSATLLTHANYPPGAHEIAFVAGVGTGTGFAANATYGVFCTLLVDSQNPTGFVGSFTLTPLATASQVDNIGSGATGGTHVEALYDNTTRDTIDNAGANLLGSGLVGIPATGHAFVAGREITIAGSVAYNGAFEVVSQTTNEVVITHAQTAEAFTGAETIVSSIKGIVFVGTVTSGTFVDTSKENGVSHSMDDDGDVIDIIYAFSIGGSRQATVAAIFTNVDGNTDQMVLSAYDFANSQWEPGGNGILIGSGGSSFHPLNPELVSRNTGTGTDLGEVFIRLHTVTTTPSSLDVDKCLLTAVGTNATPGYPKGFEIAAAGTSGTEFGVNGTAGNPCPFADAVTMNAVNTLNTCAIQNGETIQLLGVSDKFSLVGHAWTLLLDGKSIDHMHVSGAISVSGTSTGENSDFHDCGMGTCTIGPCEIIDSRFTSDSGGGFTMLAAGVYLIHHCGATVPSNGSPVFTFPAAGNTFVNDRAGSGGRQYEGMTAGDLASVEGWGQFIEGTCSGGAVTIRGCLTKSGISNITITYEARFDVEQVADAVWDETLTGANHNIANSSGRRLRALQEFQGYDGGYVWIDTVGGVAGTAPFENGTVNNPVDSLEDALIIAASISSKKLFFLPGSSETLSEDMASFLLHGQGWSLACAGFDLSNSYVQGAFVSGISTSDTQNANFKDCLMFQASFGSAVLTDCAIHTSLTATEIGNLTLNNCYDAGGGGVPYIDFSVTGVTVQLDRWAGDIEVRSMVATDSIKVVGNGTFTVHSGCTGGTAFLAGDFEVTDNASGAVAITFDDNTTSIDAIETDTGNLITRIPAALFSGITSLAQWLGLLAGKQTGNATALGEINATGAGSGTFTPVTDSLESGRDNIGDGGAGLGDLGGMSIGMSAEVISSNLTAMISLNLDHLMKTAVSNPADMTAEVADNTLMARLMTSAGTMSSYVSADDSLEAISGSGGDATEAKQDTIIASIGTPVALDSGAATLGGMLTKMADDNAGADFDAGTDSLQEIRDKVDTLSALTGGGAFTGTLTIDDGDTGLQGVVVNARLGGVLQATGTTDVNGQITNWVFDANTFDLASQISGYQPSTDTLVVSGDGWTKTISMTLIAISPPPTATTTTGVMTVLDEEGSVEEGVTITVQILDGPGTDGIGYDSAQWAETSDVNGVVQFAGIVHGARYQIWRGTTKAKVETFTAPTSGTSFDLAEVIGQG